MSMSMWVEPHGQESLRPGLTWRRALAARSLRMWNFPGFLPWHDEIGVLKKLTLLCALVMVAEFVGPFLQFMRTKSSAFSVAYFGGSMAMPMTVSSSGNLFFAAPQASSSIARRFGR
jgi:hypothetical protein